MAFEGSGTMFKKLCAIVITAIMLIISSTSVFAGNDTGDGDTYSRSQTKSAVTSPGALGKEYTAFEAALMNALKSAKTEDNGEFIFKRTSPAKSKESTYSKTFALTGESLHDYDDLIIYIAKYNENTEQYETLKNTDGESFLPCYGVFSTEIELTKGVNKIKLLAYRKSQMDDPKFQINTFTIELLNETILDKVRKKSSEIMSEAWDLISGGKNK